MLYKYPLMGVYSIVVPLIVLSSITTKSKDVDFNSFVDR